MEKFLENITFFPSSFTFYWDLIFAWGLWGIITNSTFFFNVMYCSGPVRCADVCTSDFCVFQIIFLLACPPWSSLLTTFFESAHNSRVTSATNYPFIIVRPFPVLRTVTLWVPFLFLPPSLLSSFFLFLFLSLLLSFLFLPYF